MRVAFVVQRYGLEINGGAELLCRQVVERLAPQFEIDVLTTCAQDYVTWENVYPAGLDRVNGIPVHRFAATGTRELKFGERSAWIYTHPHILHDEMAWLEAQGPVVPDLLRYLVDQHDAYDAFVFFTYIYYPTVLGLRLVSDRALLVPTAHEEPPIHLDIYNALFHTPRGILYNTVEERELLEELFGIDYIPNAVVGVGVDIPQQLDGAAFRHRYGLVDVPYVVYVGRVSPSKNCPTLLEYFVRYKEAHPGPLTLVLVGYQEIPIPNRPDILGLGFVPDKDRFEAIAESELLLLPSKFESLSMVFLESLKLGVPVLCDGTSAVLRGHCARSNAALHYDTYPEFEASLALLLRDQRLRKKLGKNGKRYVSDHYTWDRVLQQYHQLLQQVVSMPWW